MTYLKSIQVSYPSGEISCIANWTWISADEMIASSDVPVSAILLFRVEGDELALKESFPVEESVFNIARSGDGATAAVQVGKGRFKPRIAIALRVFFYEHIMD